MDKTVHTLNSTEMENDMAYQKYLEEEREALANQLAYERTGVDHGIDLRKPQQRFDLQKNLSED